jgi:hypothetical protein
VYIFARDEVAGRGDTFTVVRLLPEAAAFSNIR